MDTQSIRNFREYLRRFERVLNIQNSSSCCSGVSLAQCHALMELFKEDNITINELSDRLYLDKSTISRTVEGLVQIGLVNRNIPEKDRRAAIVSLTKQGTQVCNQINKVNDTYFEKVLDSIPLKDYPLFFSSFKIMVDKMIELNQDKNCQCN